MARRPQPESIMSQAELAEFMRSLSMLSVSGVKAISLSFILKHFGTETKAVVNQKQGCLIGQTIRRRSRLRGIVHGRS
jgi:hypothetical protein